MNISGLTIVIHDQQLNATSFQAWKKKFLNSMTFQVFNDLYEPYYMKQIPRLKMSKKNLKTNSQDRINNYLQVVRANVNFQECVCFCL